MKVQIVALVLAGGISAFTALILFGILAGLTMAFYPEQSFQMVAPLTCPNGKVDYQQYQASYDRPGEYSINIDCVQSDGSRTDISLQSIGYVLVGTYLACFVPLCLPLSIVAFIAPPFFTRLMKRKTSPSSTAA